MMASTATAFTVGTRSSPFVGTRSAAALRSLAPRHSLRRLPGMTMLFGNFFGGGAFESKIDYSKLDFPGPELAVAAEQGQVLVTSPSEPELVTCSFAGGCFWGVEACGGVPRHAGTHLLVRGLFYVALRAPHGRSDTRHAHKG